MKKRNNAADRWCIIQDMLEREGLARPHISSYNDFIKSGIAGIISDAGYVPIERNGHTYRLRFGRPEFRKPFLLESDGSANHILPLEARLRNATYSSVVMINVDVLEFVADDNANGNANDNDNGNIHVEGNGNGAWTLTGSRTIHLCNVPVMVKSDLCLLRGMHAKQLIECGEDPSDPGGYFVMNGAERVIPGMEDVPLNRILLDSETRQNGAVYGATIYSGMPGGRSKFRIYVKDGSILASVPGIPADIPAMILLRALGCTTDMQIANIISACPDIQDGLARSLDAASEIRTQDDAVRYVAGRLGPGMPEQYRTANCIILLDSIMPHLGRGPEYRAAKVPCVAEMISRILEMQAGRISPDDRDHLGNKTVKFAGELLAEVFRSSYNALLRDVRYRLQRAKPGHHIPDSAESAVSPGIITDRMNSCISTGNWPNGRSGISQMLDRTNHLSGISHLRRIQSPLSRDQPNYAARDLHPTHFGRLCPSETPEGSGCGLVKNLAAGCIVSDGSDMMPILEIFSNSRGVPWTDALENRQIRLHGSLILIDGVVLGYHADAAALAGIIRAARREGRIDPHVGVCLQNSKIAGHAPKLRIDCSAGRLLRPLLVLRDGMPLLACDTLDSLGRGNMSWRDLLYNGMMELVDASEEENCLISTDGNNTHHTMTHMEVCPNSILGAGPSQIPYPEHNQSPRITYGAAMAKQALGFSSPVLRTGTHAKQHMMAYPQTPLVDTAQMAGLGMHGRPAGVNCVVAVLPFDGYNIEDAIVMNSASVDRGLARTFFYRMYDAVEKRYAGGMADKFGIPDMQDGLSGFRGASAYTSLDMDGAAAAESVLDGNVAVVGRTSPQRSTTPGMPGGRDTSIMLRTPEKGAIDSVLYTQDAGGCRIFRVRVRDMRVPEIGDKFASRHGQKGVCGMLAAAQDLPYTAQGITPDILINPHAFPSRMTVGMLLESICGKAAAIRGRPVDGSAFAGERLDDLRPVLESAGFDHAGKEKMYDGRTGKAFQADVFIGMVYYQRLQHMVADKLHARARGPIQQMNRQPTRGRASAGGLRFGEMERDCIIAYGASAMLRDRLLAESDSIVIPVCEDCGLVAHAGMSHAGTPHIGTPHIGTPHIDAAGRLLPCRICGTARISHIRVAYGFKLLLQEIQGLGIAPRIIVGDGLSVPK